MRPSAVDTDAVRASAARTDTRSVVSGNGTRRHVRPSSESITTPPRPTSQHTVAAGAAPAVKSAATPVGTGSQLEPPLVERSTSERATRHRTRGSGDTISNPVAGGAVD